MSLDLEFLKNAVDWIVTTKDKRPERLKAMPATSDDLYYRLLYAIGEHAAPLRIVEIGTYVGASAAHFAIGNQGGEVVTIDINPDAKRQADRLGIPNLLAIHADSAAVLPALRAAVAEHGLFDVCYVDGLHNFNQAYGEYTLYRPLVKDGGLFLFDDVALDIEMETFWEYVVDPKMRFDVLHRTGFGACVKDPAVQVPSWDAIIQRATQKIIARRYASESLK